MIQRWIVVHAFLIFLTQNLFAEIKMNPLPGQICFLTKADYEQKKDKLPPILQKLPAFLTMSPLGIKGAVSIKFNEKGEVRYFFTLPTQTPAPVEQPVGICASNTELTVAFEKKPDETLSIQSPTQLKTRGQFYNPTLTVVSETKFREQLAAIHGPNGIEPNPAFSGGMKQ